MGRHGSKWLQPRLRDPISPMKKAGREREGGQGCKLLKPAPGDTIPTAVLSTLNVPEPPQTVPPAKGKVSKYMSLWEIRLTQTTINKWAQEQCLTI